MALRLSVFPPRQWSISTRLALWYGMTIFVLLGIFAVLTYINFHLSRHRDFDQHLAHEQRVLEPFIRFDASGPRFEKLDELRSVAYQTDGIYGTYVRLLTPDGHVRYESPNFERHQPLAVALPASRKEENVSRVWEEEPIRTVYLPLRTSADSLRGWLEVTGFEWSLHQELGRLTRTFGFGIFFAVLLAVAGGYLLARRALHPVAEITASANEISATDLSTRLPTRFRVQDELTKLAETINSLLDRLEASFRRERLFTANAAHEMITPLATMRGELELVLRAPGDLEACLQAIRTGLSDIDRMNRIVRALLQLSKAEQLKDMPRRPVDVGALCAEHLERFRDRADVQGTRLSLETTPGLVVSADEVNLGKVLDNLLDNAFKYTPEHGHITVATRAEGGAAVIEVSDTGCGFPPEVGQHLFDRFYRADMKAVQVRPGSGLGLAIAKTIVEAYDGTISARSDGPNEGSTFTVRIPLAG